MKKLRELCSSLPRVAKIHSPLDSVVTQMFQQTMDTEFIHSQSPPAPRYQVNVDQEMLHHHNDCLDDFDKCGPNEQYVINKIFFSTCHLVYVVGGLGVGKTTFSKYLMDHILHKVRHRDSSGHLKCPGPIYFDFLPERAISDQGKSFEDIQSEFLGLFCTYVEATLINKPYFADVTEEVEVVWDAVIAAHSTNRRNNPASSYIVKRVFEEQARILPNDVELRRDVLGRRLKIREEIMRSESLRLHYLAQLLNYIRDKYYQDHNQCFLIIVDNIDREPSLVQRAVGSVLKPFANNCQIRIVVNVRQTTYYHGQGDNLSETVDWVVYCGPKPLSIVRARINDLLQYPEKYERFYAPSDLPQLSKGIAEIRDNFLNSDRFVNFFEALTGNSIRKALLLSQNLILNSIYDPYEIGNDVSVRANLSDGLRALMVGAGAAYTYDVSDIVENVFEVQQHKGESPLLKLRVLRALSASEHGVTINRLMNTLEGFEYPVEVVKDALNDMIGSAKRLAWSDAVNRFDSVQHFLDLGGTRLFISTIGLGYETVLCKRIEYLQEVMLDTSVSSEFVSHFGTGYDYGKMEDRFKMLSRFCTFLAMRDMEELELFVGDLGAKSYRKAFGSQTTLISKEILECVMHDVGKILDYVIDHAHGDLKNSRVELRDEMTARFNDWQLRFGEFEKTVFA